MSHAIYWEDDSGQLQQIVFDRLDLENHEAPTDVTEFPVEEGSDINDNARPGVKRLQLEGYISNKPLLSNLRASLEVAKADYQPEVIRFEQTTLAGHRVERLNLPESEAGLPLGPGAVTAAIYRAIESFEGPTFAQLVNYLKTPTATTARVLKQHVELDRVADTQEKLNDIWENSRILHVVTSLEYYTDMLIENRVSSRRKQDGTGATFSLDLKRVTFVSSELVAAPNPSFKVPLGSRAAVQVDTNSASYQAKLAELAALRPDSIGALSQ